MRSGIFNAKITDLRDIAVCHKSAFPRSLSSSLGTRYLQSMLSWYLASDETFLFYIRDESKLVAGYCGGVIVNPERISGSASGMAQHSFSAALKAFALRPWLIFHPELKKKYKFVFKNVLRRMIGKNKYLVKKQRSAKIRPQTERYAALVVIGVSEKAQGKGFGTRLLEEFETVTQRLGLKKMLLTVRTDNVHAIRVYERSGWMKVEERTASTTMIKMLDKKENLDSQNRSY